MSRPGVSKPGPLIVDGHVLWRGRGGIRKKPIELPKPKPARIAKLLAQAHKIRDLVRSGTLKSYADAARRHGMSRAQMSRITHLTLLAPDIQQEIVKLEAVNGVEPPITEGRLRPLTLVKDHDEQRRMWRQLAKRT